MPWERVKKIFSLQNRFTFTYLYFVITCKISRNEEFYGHTNEKNMELDFFFYILPIFNFLWVYEFNYWSINFVSEKEQSAYTTLANTCFWWSMDL